MSLLSLMTTTAALQRPTTTADAYGGQVSTFADVTGLSSFPCTVQPASGRTVEQFAARSMQVSHTLYTPTDITAATAGDRVVVGSAKYLVQWAEDQAGRGQVFALHLRKE